MKRPLSLRIGFLIAVQVMCGTSLVIDNNNNNNNEKVGEFVSINHHNEHPIVPVQPTIDVESFNNNNNNGEIFNWSTHRHLLKHRPHPSYLDTHIQQPQRPSSSTFSSSSNNNNNEGQQQHRKLYHRTTGTFHNLVLLIRFSNHVSRTLPTRQSISRLYNSEETSLQRSSSSSQEEEDVIPTGSVRQVYLSNSQNTFKIETTVVDWITVSGTEEYYGNGNHGFSKLKEAIIEVLQKLDEGEANVNGVYGEGIKFDFNSFDINDDNALDGLGILHSGYGAEFGGEDCYGTINEDRIWSHKGGLTWSSSGGENVNNKVNVNRYYVSSALRGKCNSNIVRMGVICHELGHYLGLPDLYDSTFEGAGLGAYDYMSQSWGFDGSGKYPPNLCAWSKLHVGWAKATVIDKDGTYTISASDVDEGSTSTNNKVYKIQSGYPDGEYLLIENRQPIGYDVKINGEGGIAIYHVDDNVNGQGVRGYPSSSSSSDSNGWPNNGHHYQVALLSADGKYDLEKGVNQGDSGDLWASRSSSTTTTGTGLVLNELKAGSSQYPNTDSYQNGIVTETGIRIYGFSESGHVMTFRVEGLPPVVVEEEEEEVVSTTTTTPPPTTANPTTANPTTLQPTSKSPTNAPTTYQPTPLPSSKPTTLSPTTEIQLCTNLCLIPISPDECPSDIITAQLPDCTSSSTTQGVQIGELCDADGECNSDQFLDNCLFYDIYRRVDCNSTTVEGEEEDATVIVIVDGGTPQFEGNDILPDNLSTTRPTLKPTTAGTPPPSVDTLTTTLDDTTVDNNNNNDCPYYPGWNQGLSHCLKDCHQPSYMQGNPTFEFITLEQCCELHYAGTVSCKTQSVLALETSYANTFAKITGQVWNDVNGNDWQDASERGMGDGVHGVLVDLYDCTEYTPDGSGSSSWVKGTQTSLDGSYVFDTIYTPGSYYVQITVPTGYTLSLEQSWLAETEYDSDFNILGRSECIEFGSSNDDGSSSNLDLMLDAGLIPNALATTSVQPTSKPTVAAVTSPPPTSQPTTSKPTTAGIAVEAVSQVEEDEPATIQSAAASFSASGMHSKSATTSYSTLDSSVTIEQVTPSFLRGSSSSSSNTNDVVLVYPTSEATIHSQQDMKFIGGEDELLIGPQLSWQDDTLLKFDLTDGLSSSSQQDYRAATQAVLSLYSLTSSQSGGAVHFASSNVDWDASSVTWSTAPKAGHVLGTIGETKPNTWIEVDVTGLLLSEDGHVTLRITSEKNNHSWVAKYSSSSSSKENYVPVLKVYF